jgi:zinc transporter ZupT
VVVVIGVLAAVLAVDVASVWVAAVLAVSGGADATVTVLVLDPHAASSAPHESASAARAAGRSLLITLMVFAAGPPNPRPPLDS